MAFCNGLQDIGTVLLFESMTSRAFVLQIGIGTGPLLTANASCAELWILSETAYAI
jgi:hypothetical protein